MTKTALRLTVLALSFAAFVGGVAAEQVSRTQSNDEQAPRSVAADPVDESQSDGGTLRAWSIAFPTQTEPQDFAVGTDPQAVSLLLPAVQAAREAAR